MLKTLDSSKDLQMSNGLNQVHIYSEKHSPDVRMGWRAGGPGAGRLLRNCCRNQERSGDLN